MTEEETFAPKEVDAFANKAIGTALKKRIEAPFEFLALRDTHTSYGKKLDKETIRLAVKMEIRGETVYCETWGYETLKEVVEACGTCVGEGMLASIHRIKLKNIWELAERLRWQLIYRETFERTDALRYLSQTEQMDMLKRIASESKDTREALARTHEIDIPRIGTPK